MEIASSICSSRRCAIRSIRTTPTRSRRDYDEDDFDQVIAINLKGVFLGMKYAIPLMLARGGGSIINTSSMEALVSFPGMVGYCASKGGVSMMTKLTAAEYAVRGIRVNAILPGAIDTGMTRAMAEDYVDGAVANTLMGRIGEPIEIANLALFLASDESSFITARSPPSMADIRCYDRCPRDSAWSRDPTAANGWRGELAVA